MEPGEDTEVLDDVLRLLREMALPQEPNPRTRAVWLLGIFVLTCALLMGFELIMLFLLARTGWWALRGAAIVMAGLAVTSTAHFISRRLEIRRGKDTLILD